MGVQGASVLIVCFVKTPHSCVVIGVQTADEEMRTDQGKVKRGHKFVKAQWLSLLEALSDGGLRYSAPAGANTCT